MITGGFPKGRQYCLEIVCVEFIDCRDFIRMAVRCNFGIIKKKPMIAITCIIGISSVFFGMYYDNNIVFIVGVIITAGGYILIRGRLKEKARKM